MSNTLTAKQTQAIALLATGLSITAAAEQVKIDRTTIHSWKRLDPDFSDALRDAQDDAAAQTRASYQQDVAEARTVLRTLMLDPKAPPSVRLKAALHILAKAEPPAPKPETRDERRDKRLLRHGVDPRFEADTYTEFVQQKKAEEAEAQLDALNAIQQNSSLSDDSGHTPEPPHPQTEDEAISATLAAIQQNSSPADISERLAQWPPQMLAEFHDYLARQAPIQHNSSPGEEEQSDPEPQAA